MGKKSNRQAIHITFHNPNTNEETAKFLTKIIAENMACQIINKKLQLENETA